jgi:signal transduction histidine kinase
MLFARTPDNESERLANLDLYEILDTFPEEAFDAITSIAAHICGTPIALISLIDKDRQWFKSHHGLTVSETPRDFAFCAHAILDPDQLFVVEDAQLDNRFADNPLSTGDPNVIFYAGAPLVSREGFPLGTLCVIDNKPHTLNSEQRKALADLSNQVIAQMELRRIVKELKSKNDELCRYAHLVSHDLRSPMQSIYQLSKMIAKESQGQLNEKAEKALEQLQKKAFQSQELVDGILKHSLAGEQAYTPEKIQLPQFINELIEFCSPPSDFRIDTEVSVSEIVSDSIILKQILQNLISNAIKYNNKAQGLIRIVANANESELMFEVIDNGPGIPEKFHERIFGMFQTLSHADRFGNKGTGIGLHTVKNLVTLLGGQISIQSKVGEGSTFKIILKNYSSNSIEENLPV